MDLQIEIMDNLKLEQGKTYLLKYGTSHTLSSVTVLMVSEKGYYLRWNSGINSSESWELKTHIDNNHWLIEDITDLMEKKSTSELTNNNEEKTDWKKYLASDPIYKTALKAVQCPVCGGMGVVSDEDSTVGTKLCPRCFGGKIVME